MVAIILSYDSRNVIRVYSVVEPIKSRTQDVHHSYCTRGLTPSNAHANHLKWPTGHQKQQHYCTRCCAASRCTLWVCALTTTANSTGRVAAAEKQLLCSNNLILEVLVIFFVVRHCSLAARAVLMIFGYEYDNLLKLFAITCIANHTSGPQG